MGLTYQVFDICVYIHIYRVMVLGYKANSEYRCLVYLYMPEHEAAAA